MLNSILRAYCDRILFKGDMITQHHLTRLECKVSDHRPVHALFTVQVKEIDQKAFAREEKIAAEHVDALLQAAVYAQKLEWIRDSLGVSLEDAESRLTRARGDLRLIFL